MIRTLASSIRARLDLAGVVLFSIGAGLASPAAGSFECLPGPIPGGISDLAGQSAVDQRDGDRAWRAALSIGRPAGVRELAWTHGWFARAVGSAHLRGEGFVLAFEDLYREQVVGLWVGSGRIEVGLRHWQTVWDETITRSGWTGSLLTKVELRPIRIVAGLQDLRLGRLQRAAPSMRVGGLATIQAEPSIDLLCGIHRYREVWGAIGGLRWRCTDELTLQEEIAIPDGSPRTSLQVDAGSARIGLWFEPSSTLGWRLGMTCTFSR